MRPFDRFVNLNENGSGGPAYRRCRFLGGAGKRGELQGACFTLPQRGHAAEGGRRSFPAHTAFLKAPA